MEADVRALSLGLVVKETSTWRRGSMPYLEFTHHDQQLISLKQHTIFGLSALVNDCNVQPTVLISLGSRNPFSSVLPYSANISNLVWTPIAVVGCYLAISCILLLL